MIKWKGLGIVLLILISVFYIGITFMMGVWRQYQLIFG
jgi:hypothetical protein